MQESRYGHLKINYIYKCLNMHRAILPYPVWNKVKVFKVFQQIPKTVSKTKFAQFLKKI
jgi:hypothetical protein